MALSYGTRKKEPDQVSAVLIEDTFTQLDLQELLDLQSRYVFASLMTVSTVPKYWRVVLSDLVTGGTVSFTVGVGNYITYDPNIDSVFMQPEQAWERMYNQTYTNEFLDDAWTDERVNGAAY